MFNGLGTGSGVQAKWAQSFTASNTGTGGFSLVTGRFGGQALKYDTSGSFGRALALGFAGTATLSIGFALRIDAYGTVDYTFPLMFTTGASYQFALAVDHVGGVSIQRTTANSAGTVVGAAAPAGTLQTGIWNYFVLTISMGTTTTGSYALYMNGSPTPLLSATNVNLLNFTTSNLIDAIHFGAGRLDSRLGAFTIDDIWIDNTVNNRGERRIEVLRPNADITKAWSPLTGVNNYAMVNETLVDGDTSYVSATNVGDRDLYSLTALSSTPATIDSINIVSFAEKTDASTRAVYNSVQSGGVDSDGSAFNLTTTYVRNDRLLLTDPNGGGAWSAAAVNALRIGPKVAT